jgi:hypothetical protein
VLDFNRANLSLAPISAAINALIEQAAACEIEEPRPYLGASVIGAECLRQVQYDWQVEPIHPARLRDTFARGHFFEAQSRKHLADAGFRFAPVTALGFCVAGGLFRGHADGAITGGPDLPGAGYPCIWEHKALGSKGWRKLERDGLLLAYPQYAAQVSLYQAYLGFTDHPAIFTATNANTCARLHLLLPFDAVAARTWIDRATTIINATRAGELLARLAKTPSNPCCVKCSHTERCWNDAGRQ